MSIETRIAAMMAAATLVTAAVGQNTEKPGVEITYLANEGLLIQAAETSVVIDGLFRSGVSGYERVPAAELEKLETARPPYDTVSLLLVSHYHADHFDAKSVARHLEHNPKAKLVSSEQVVKQVRAAAKSEVKPRIESVEPKDADRVAIETGGVKIEFLKLSHGTGRFAKIANLGHIIELNGIRILHIGDAELNAKTVEPLEKHAKGVDVACIPYWLLLSERGRKFVLETLAPRHIVAIHVPPKEADDVTARIHAHIPAATIFTKPMTTKRF